MRYRNISSTLVSPWLNSKASSLLLLLLSLAIFLTSCTAQRPLPILSELQNPESPIQKELIIRIGVKSNATTHVNNLPLEEYVVGTLLAEMPLGSLDRIAAERVGMIQAILSRTYALANLGRHDREGYDLCSTTHCQVFRPEQNLRSDAYSIALIAVRSTRDLIVSYGSEPIQALYHSDCGGSTTSAGSVWGGPTPPYLHPVSDAHQQRPWQFKVDIDSLKYALNQNVKTTVGARLDRISIAERDISDRVIRLVLDGEHSPMVRGEEFRSILTQTFGPTAIRSTRFTVGRENNTFLFEGLGYGHGVGLCQIGAIARVIAGDEPETILEYYYPGTSLIHLDETSLHTLGQ